MLLSCFNAQVSVRSFNSCDLLVHLELISSWWIKVTPVELLTHHDRSVFSCIMEIVVSRNSFHKRGTSVVLMLEVAFLSLSEEKPMFITDF